MFLLSDLQQFALAQYSPNGEPVKLWMVPWWIPIRFGVVAAGSTAALPITIAANGDFIFTELLAFVPIADPTTVLANNDYEGKPAPYARVLLTDNSTGDSFMDRPVLVDNYARNGMGDMSLTIPRFLPGRNAVTAQVTALGEELVGGIELVMAGVLVRAYDASGAEVTRGV